MVLPVLDVSKHESYFFQIKRKYRRYLSSKMPRYGLKTVSLYLFVIFFLYIVIDISGVFRHPLERDYYTEFSYPLDVDNFPSVVERFRQGEPVAYDPINSNYSSLKYSNTAENGCDVPLRLLILIKSAPGNFENREAIRATWGYPRRFSDVPIKAVFLLGQLSGPEMEATTLQGDGTTMESKIQQEIHKYGDIVRANFTDSYYNNTMKTMMGMRWAAEFCSNFRFIFFVDDDMYVSIKNLLKFVRYPTQYPEYWEQQKKNYHPRLPSKKEFSQAQDNNTNSLISNNILPVETIAVKDSKKLNAEPYRAVDKTKNSPFDFDIDLDKNAKLYAGYVFFVPPHRHKVGTKWFLPLSEYPFNYFPPYVPAGAIIMSKAAFLDIYYASYFTKHFRFDDIFVALCAKKMGIEPYHNNYFRFWPAPIKDPYEKDYEYVITSHGYHDPQELRTFWNVQKSLGHA